MSGALKSFLERHDYGDELGTLEEAGITSLSDLWNESAESLGAKLGSLSWANELIERSKGCDCSSE